MKLSDQLIFDDAAGKVIHKKVHSNEPYLDMARQYRDAGVGMKGEHRLVGVIPTHLINEWIKEAGISWDEPQAVQEVMRRKILSGEFDKFRVWDGRY